MGKLNLGVELKEVVHHVSTLLSTIASIHKHVHEGMSHLPQALSRLEKVTSETATATHQLMDILDNLGENDKKMLTLIGQLEKAEGGSAGSAAPYAELKSIISRNQDSHSKILEALQFQDLTSQQINYVGSLLDKVENELISLAEAVGLDYSKQLKGHSERVYHAEATYDKAGQKQTAVDSLVKEMKEKNEAE